MPSEMVKDLEKDKEENDGDIIIEMEDDFDSYVTKQDDKEDLKDYEKIEGKNVTFYVKEIEE